ncbi:hypothetical protein ACTPEM_25240, partial [Clostridioides difficile]
IVPDFAEVWYYIRGVKMEHVRDVFGRIVDIAKGAALMTGTIMYWWKSKFKTPKDSMSNVNRYYEKLIRR